MANHSDFEAESGEAIPWLGLTVGQMSLIVMRPKSGGGDNYRWDFNLVVIAHGLCIIEDAHRIIEKAFD